MKRAIFLGYPIGITKRNNEFRFSIEQRNYILECGNYGYEIWKKTSCGCTLEDFIEFMNEKNQEFKYEVQNLIKQGVIIVLDINNYEKSYECLKKLIPVRQGLISDVNESSYEVSLGNRTITIDRTEYIVWLNLSGNSTIDDISKVLMKELNLDSNTINRLIVVTIQTLLNKNLIILR